VFHDVFVKRADAEDRGIQILTEKSADDDAKMGSLGWKSTQ
jgi:hypothetical protein